MNHLGNRSHATRAQRAEPHDSLDDFPTPMWAARALCVHVIHPLIASPAEIGRMTCWEPAANRGYMARALAEYFRRVTQSDVHDYGVGISVRDFLFSYPDRPDWIITNPPFRLAEQFVLRALCTMRCGVAVLVRLQFLESRARFKRLFQAHPPLLIAQFVERVAIVRGRLDRAASTATAYAWVVWHAGSQDRSTRFLWIPPCRAELERDEDWPE